MNRAQTAPVDLTRHQREAQFLHALAHPARLAILDLLAEGERCGCEVEPYLGLDQSTVSRHLQILKRAGALEARKEGVRVMYSLRNLTVLELRRQAARLVTQRAREELELLSEAAAVE